MAKASQPAVTDDDIFFELERFEPTEGRLALSGRWFGIRGRRFVRPTLTLAVEGERMRALADLDDKPWAAEDGEPWQASFPWAKTGQVEEPELSVAPDITISLPAPGARRTRSQRLAAQPRRAAMNASWGSLVATIEAPAAEPADEPMLTPPEADEPPLTPPEADEPTLTTPEVAADPAALRAEIETLRTELTEARGAATTAGGDLDALRSQLSTLRTEREETQRELSLRDADLEAARAELGASRAARDAALRSGAQAEADRDEALSRAAEVEAERNALTGERADLTAALEERRTAVEELERRQVEASNTRGAALVMRGATQALPAYDPHVGWIRRSLVVVVLLGIVFAVLILLGVL